MSMCEIKVLNSTEYKRCKYNIEQNGQLLLQVLRKVQMNSIMGVSICWARLCDAARSSRTEWTLFCPKHSLYLEDLDLLVHFGFLQK